MFLEELESIVNASYFFILDISTSFFRSIEVAGLFVKNYNSTFNIASII
jgi:hypothetical protein